MRTELLERPLVLVLDSRLESIAQIHLSIIISQQTSPPRTEVELRCVSNQTSLVVLLQEWYTDKMTTHMQQWVRQERS